jgi:hypothetical protein
MEIQPKDPSKKHFYVSLIKSAFRIVAGFALFSGSTANAGTFLVLAEVLGIVEEMV